VSGLASSQIAWFPPAALQLTREVAEMQKNHGAQEDQVRAPHAHPVSADDSNSSPQLVNDFRLESQLRERCPTLPSIWGPAGFESHLYCTHSKVRYSACILVHHKSSAEVLAPFYHPQGLPPAKRVVTAERSAARGKVRQAIGACGFA